MSASTHGAFWRAVETIHDVVYFAPEAKATFEAIGAKGFWMGYFASRSAALGRPGPELVAATFHGFNPAMVAKALPAAWDLMDRDEVLAARTDLARRVLTPIVESVSPGIASTESVSPGATNTGVERLARSLSSATDDLDLAGKPLAAAHRSVPKPTDPVALLWHAATIFREMRGDCHVAVLTAAGLGGCAANALQVATGRAEPVQQRSRGWSDAQWDAAQESLRDWQWLDEFYAVTDTGRAARQRLEDATDRASDTSLGMTTRARIVTVTESLEIIARGVADAGAVPFPNPTGGQRP